MLSIRSLFASPKSNIGGLGAGGLGAGGLGAGGLGAGGLGAGGLGAGALGATAFGCLVGLGLPALGLSGHVVIFVPSEPHKLQQPPPIWYIYSVTENLLQESSVPLQ